jgi:hypothetical protein
MTRFHRPRSAAVLTAVLLGSLVAAGAGTPAAADPEGHPPPVPVDVEASAETVGSYDMDLIGHDPLAGGGKMGEGFGEVSTDDGRRILYAAQESGPGCFSTVDVTDPTRPMLLRQEYVANEDTRCNSLDVSGDLLVVANQVTEPGQTNAGLQVFDISDPTDPVQVGFFDASGPYSRGTHYVWFADGRYAYLGTGLPDFQPNRVGLDDQVFAVVDLQDPTDPQLVGDWWYPGTRVGDPEPVPTPAPIDSGCRIHNIDVFPSEPDRAYLGYLDCGIVVLDISDKSAPTVVARRDDSPPTTGFTHTAMPINGGEQLLVTHESVSDNCTDAPKQDIIVANDESLAPISRLPEPDSTTRFCAAGGRYGSHNVYEPAPDELALQSDEVVFTAWFNGGVRAFDVSDPEEPRLVAYNVPAPPEGSTAATIQLNDVYVDDRGIIFAGDRAGGGLLVFRSSVTEHLD